MATKLDRLIEKEAQLKAQIQQAKATERTLEKKRDTRRKVLIGAAVMARVESGRWPQADLLKMMDGFLTRPNERELFELDVAETASTEASGKPATEKKQQAKAITDKGRSDSDGKKRPQASRQTASQLPESDLDIEKEFNL
ncbi:MAG: hypothetical protein DCF25_05865 [Leptolyngbya foveolarum]|uniref:Mobilization protein n=1 Tax=Leptolyngbya foveolarum TaxID=47253 RepID=A0A2W4UVG6_9CYAN|nr:MAG: hypothetical protein DCF25_05865 [Leptolyngbya foveolarum]